jgi:peptide deformylase
MLVVKGFGSDRPEIIEMINPVITDLSPKKTVGDEGCLSFPGETIAVDRHDYLRVTFFDREGVIQTLDTVYQDPMLSVEIQHEYDHLHGKTLADYVGPMKRDVMRRRLQKAKQAQSIVWKKLVEVTPAYKAKEFK